ncbi:MAG TPA: DUF3060 domain-containing protein [Candidatus Xenobia bacterium]|jgi:hypothetical protein
MKPWHLFALAALVGTAALADDWVVINKSKVTQTCQGDHLNVTINGNSCKVTVTGECEALNIRGRKNELTATQKVTSILVPGVRNRITFQKGFANCNVGGDENTIVLAGPYDGTKPPRIELTGGGNTLLWSRAAYPTPPNWVDDGAKNTIKAIP